jgi:hypothetical protein
VSLAAHTDSAHLAGRHNFAFIGDWSAPREAFGSFSDDNNLLQPGRNPSISRGAGNGVLYTSEEMIYLSKMGAITGNDRRQFVALVRSLQATEGLINRNPPSGYHDDQEGPDDYIGLTAAAHVLGGEAQKIADEVASYGDSHLWFMNNVRQGSSLDNGGQRNISAFFARFPWYIAHFHHCAGHSSNPIFETAWAAFIAKGARENDSADGLVLQWLMIQCLPPSASPIVKAAVLGWTQRFKKNFPNGLRDINGKMFVSDHPLVRFAPAPEEYDFQGIDDILASLIVLLQNQAEIVIKAIVDDAEHAFKFARELVRANPRAALAELGKLALAQPKVVGELAKNLKDEAGKVAGAIAKTEQNWQHKIGKILFPKGPCDIALDNDHGTCERAVEPANGWCDSKCAECDQGIDGCFQDCESKCGQCPDADQTSCHNDCNSECGRCGDNQGCRGALCNDAHRTACHNGCNGRANAGAGCRGAWCGNGQAVQGCRNGCTGRRNAAAGCRGAWCGQGEAVVGCHQTQNLKRDDCKRGAEEKRKQCHD